MLPGIKSFDLTGKVALITGGSKGIGYAMAAGLASAGADVALASRHEDEAKAAAAEIARDFGKRAIGIRADVGEPKDVDAMVARVMKDLGGVDILINNAGIAVRGNIEDVTIEQFRESTRVNVDGVWLPSKAVVPHMKAKKSGRIINISSALGLVGIPERTAYCSSKGAVVQMTRALANELAPFNITVNAICPGPFMTDMARSAQSNTTFQQFVLNAVALGRWGELEELQGAAIFLASAAGSYVTGVALPVDGGWTSR